MYLNANTLDSFLTGMQVDVILFLPELVLCGTIVLLLLLRLLPIFDRSHLGRIALVFTVIALLDSWYQWNGYSIPHWMQWTGNTEDLQMLQPESFAWSTHEQEMFSGLLVFDNFTIFLRLFLFGFAALLILLSLLTGIPDREDSADFYCLLLGATVGMSLMASANHLLMVYIGVEMASLPSYALAGFLKGRRQSSEAALKYVVYGGGASGVMLYGISLLAGKFGTAYLPDLALGYVSVLKQAGGLDPVILLGTLFILIGMGFKLAAVPFHFWCPDVFEGASSEVAAFLSVASKGAALALVARFTLILTGVAHKAADEAIAYDNWLEVARFLAPALAFFAGLTATFGNLAAYPQTNLKRLLAYSTIAHAGYMMMGLAPLTPEGASTVLFYLVAYLFMNLGAFAIVAFLRNQTGSEDLESYRGLGFRSPQMGALLGVFLLSLLGMPPLAGFAAKFQIFSVLFDAGKKYTALGQPALGNIMYALLAVGGLNTALSAVYYIKVLRIMFLERTVEEVEGEQPQPITVPMFSSLYATVLAVIILVLGIAWNPLSQASVRGVDRFRKAPKPVEAARQVNAL